MATAVHFEPFAVLRRAAIEKVGGWDDRLETGRTVIFLVPDRDGLVISPSCRRSASAGSGRGPTEAPADYPAIQADGIGMAEKHRDLYAAHYPAMIGAYEVALAKVGAAWSERGSSSGAERAVRDLTDQLAAVRAELARSEADGVRAREIVADVAAEPARGQEARAQVEALDREISAIRATRSQRLVTACGSVYEKPLTPYPGCRTTSRTEGTMRGYRVLVEGVASEEPSGMSTLGRGWIW